VPDTNDKSHEIAKLRESPHDRVRGSVSGILLAGGESRRMGGVNKALLKVGGTTIIERSASALCQAFEEVLVITNSPDDFRFLGLPMLRDVVPRRGSLGGLYTGLGACKGDYGFLVACDMPFLSADVIRHIANLVQGCDVVVPRISGMLEPLHAAYSRGCLPHIEELLQHKELKILNLYDKVKVREVPEEDLLPLDPELRFIVNVNTPEDLQRARDYAGLSGE
jgi:molybdopterin-guanine dinucleotide biosynthesis protein A